MYIYIYVHIYIQIYIRIYIYTHTRVYTYDLLVAHRAQATLGSLDLCTSHLTQLKF